MLGLSTILRFFLIIPIMFAAPSTPSNSLKLYGCKKVYDFFLMLKTTASPHRFFERNFGLFLVSTFTLFSWTKQSEVFLTLDGCRTDVNEECAWAHRYLLPHPPTIDSLSLQQYAPVSLRLNCSFMLPRDNSEPTNKNFFKGGFAAEPVS